MTLIRAEDLTLGYETGVVAEHISFTVEEGDYLCIIGENGSGKSTLIKALLKLREPMGGALRFDGGLSAREIVQSGCQGRCGLRPFYRKEEKQLAADNMERMGIADLADRCYRELSGGQQQRVLLARALCATQKLLLLDEPVTGLDPHVTAQLYALIEQLNKEGLTLIMVSHDVTAAVRYASHILHIGRENFFGTKEEFLESRIGRVFFAEEGGEADV